MAEIVFSMQLQGKGVPVEGQEGTFHAETSGTGPDGENVTFDSLVVLTDAGFDEVGTITYSGRGSLKFDTVGIRNRCPIVVGCDDSNATLSSDRTCTGIICSLDLKCGLLYYRDSIS